MLHGMWDLPGPGLERVSPALADRFLTTALPGKSLCVDLVLCNFVDFISSSSLIVYSLGFILIIFVS